MGFRVWGGGLFFAWGLGFPMGGVYLRAVEMAYRDPGELYPGYIRLP